MYEAMTADIVVGVEPHFLQDETDLEVPRFVWAYTVTIENRSERAVQLLKRRWEITDARGFRHVVEGDGVVGEQPILPPGGQYGYTSAAPLTTPSGFMVGAYTMTHTGTGDRFDVAIPAFPLDSPYARPLAN